MNFNHLIGDFVGAPDPANELRAGMGNALKCVAAYLNNFAKFIREGGIAPLPARAPLGQIRLANGEKPCVPAGE